MSVSDDMHVAKPETEAFTRPKPRSMLPYLVLALVLVGGFFFGRNFLANAQESGREQGQVAMRKFMRYAFRTDKPEGVSRGVATEEAQRQATEIVNKHKGLVGPRTIRVTSVGMLGTTAEGEVEAEFVAGKAVLLLKTQGEKVSEVIEKPGTFNSEPVQRPTLGVSGG